MTDPHPLTPLLAPRSVAIFGASNDPERISGRPLRYFLEAGYQGAIYPINPNRDRVQGLRAYPDLDAVTDPVEFALIAVPAALATTALEASIAKGVRAVVMFTAGFAETGAEGAALQLRLAEIARQAACGSAARIVSVSSTCAPATPRLSVLISRRGRSARARSAWSPSRAPSARTFWRSPSAAGF
jgi:predicted CoA-binding protein